MQYEPIVDEQDDTTVVDFASAFDEEDESPLPLLGKVNVDLPGGYTLPDGTVTKKATVRELNGYDEEKLTRADVKRPIDFLRTLILLGVESIGNEKMVAPMIDTMLLGDRDTLVLGIRNATFGDKLEYRELVCPNCTRTFDVEASLDEIPIKKLEEDRVFEIELLHGSKALVRLATHGDQAAMIDETDKLSDQNTVLLARCMLRIGNTDVQVGFDPAEETVKGLNMRDRQLILREMAERQPGPDFQGVKIVCPHCDFEDRLNIDPLGLFRI